MKKRIILYIISFSLVLFFVICELIKAPKPFQIFYQSFESICYISFIAIYAFYVKTKMYDRRIKRSISIIASFLIMWHIIKVVRWQNELNDFKNNIYWYMYYIPMVFIPITYFYLFYSLSFNTSKKKRTIITLLVTVGVLIVSMVLTNDYHEFVFRLHKDDSYSYFIGYFIFIFFVLFLVIYTFCFALVSSIKNKSLVKKDLKYIFLEFTGIAIYCILFCLGFLKNIPTLNEITCIFTIFVLLLTNTLIYAGLLNANLESRKVFNNSSMKLILTDDEYNIYEKSNYSNNLSIDEMKSIVDNSSIYLDTVLVSKKTVPGGYLFYEKDLSSFLNLKKELEYNKDALEKRIEAQRKTKEIKEEIIRNKYLNEINEKFHQNILDVLNDIKEIENSDLSYENKIKEICLILIYLKRESLFLIFRDPNELKDSQDLVLALNELVEYLKKIDVNCNILFDEKMITFLDVLNIYREVYSFIVLARKNKYNNLFIAIKKIDSNFEIRMTIENANYINSQYEEILDENTLLVRKVI